MFLQVGSLVDVLLLLFFNVLRKILGHVEGSEHCCIQEFCCCLFLASLREIVHIQKRVTLAQTSLSCLSNGSAAPFTPSCAMNEVVLHLAPKCHFF